MSIPDVLLILAAAVAGYSCGAIPFACLVARRHGVDILREGSGNPGATNVRRVIGKRAGNTVFALDFLKGLLATGWPMALVAGEHAAVFAAIAGLAGAVAGHSYSVFIGFRGGKGVATTMGGLIAILPLAVLAGILVWLAVFKAFRYVSLASLCFAASLPVTVALSAPEPRGLLLVFSIAVAALIFYRHRTNIRQLLEGSEHRFQGGGEESNREREHGDG